MTSRLPVSARLPIASKVRSLAAGVVSGVALFGAAPASAQDSPAAPWSQTTPTGGISVRAQVDVMFQPPEGGPVVLMQKAFETGTEGQNLSSEYVFNVLNTAVLAGVDQALAKGATAGRVNVVAVCYAYSRLDNGLPSPVPMGVFINTTDMDVIDGKAALHSNVKYVPPIERQSGPQPIPLPFQLPEQK